MIVVPELTLLPIDAPLLAVPTLPFNFDDPPHDPKKLKEAMELLMYRIEGAGLSANQVGIPYSVFVIGTLEQSRACFNPRILGVSKDTCLFKEGCLSLPGIWLSISRPTEVKVEFQDENGMSHALQLGGAASRVFQHEFDHMMGKNFTQRASPLKLKRALAALRKKNGNL